MNELNQIILDLMMLSMSPCELISSTKETSCTPDNKILSFRIGFLKTILVSKKIHEEPDDWRGT
jgi:hypothetical protein